MMTENKRFLGIIFTVFLILLTPLIAMQFTAEVNWTLSDFIVAGGLLFSVVIIAEIILRKVKQPTTRIVLLIFVLVALLIVWAELAVGIF